MVGAKAGQRGLSLIGMILVTILIVCVVVIGMKVVPPVVEYYKIVQAVRAIGSDSALAGASPMDVRNAYTRRVMIEDIESVSPADLQVVRDGNRIILSFAYEKRIQLFGPVSLLIDFEGSSDK